jgi:hypothetical protein
MALEAGHWHLSRATDAVVAASLSEPKKESPLLPGECQHEAFRKSLQ